MVSREALRACVVKNYSWTTAVDVNKYLGGFKLQISLHTCVTCSELTINLNKCFKKFMDRILNNLVLMSTSALSLSFVLTFFLSIYYATISLSFSFSILFFFSLSLSLFVTTQLTLHLFPFLTLFL